jgi:diketogulonate reductase-like aldo/keto reductase
MKTVKLNNGIKMPILVFGVFQIKNPEECEKAVLNAVCTGYRLIDTAMSYRNEEAVGQAIRKCGVLREELFITTKLWLADAGYDKTMKAFETSLNNLGLEYLDLYLIHQPVGDYYGSWRAMEELYKKGVVRAIGVSNFMPDRLVDLVLNNEVPPAINQVEVNPFCQRVVDQEMRDKKKVQSQSWGPVADGRNGLLENETLKAIGAKYNKSVAQVVLRWLVQRGVVSIPKSVHKERMTENFNIFDFEMPDEDMKAIAALDTGKSCFFSHQDPSAIEMLCGLKR